MGTVRVYLSFDPIHDGDLKGRLLEEAAKSCSGFEIHACSEATEMTEAWSTRARRRIGDADEVIVICGEHTDDSVQVAAEVGMAREQQKPYFMLWGRREAMCTKPLGAKPSEGIYSWTTSIVRYQVATTLRVARTRKAPQPLARS